MYYNCSKVDTNPNRNPKTAFLKKDRPRPYPTPRFTDIRDKGEVGKRRKCILQFEIILPRLMSIITKVRTIKWRGSVLAGVYFSEMSNLCRGFSSCR